MTQRVFVIMGNEFPETVFASFDDARDYCERQKQRRDQDLIEGGKEIRWRVYGFDLQPNSNALGQGARSGEGEVSRGSPRDSLKNECGQL